MPQCSNDVQQLNVRMAAVEADVDKLKTAFVLNDLNTPDYDGHRKDHYQRSKAAEDEAQTMRELKAGATKKILLGLLGAAMTLISFGLLPYLRSLLGGL